MINRRREFTKATKREARDRSGGICECHRLVNVPGLVPGGCGQPLVAGETFYEHANPTFISSDNSLANCAALTKTCWKIKTASYDLPTIAKVKRVKDAWHGISGAGRPMDGSRRSRFKVHVNGAVDLRPGR